MNQIPRLPWGMERSLDRREETCVSLGKSLLSLPHLSPLQTGMLVFHAYILRI